MNFVDELRGDAEALASLGHFDAASRVGKAAMVIEWALAREADGEAGLEMRDFFQDGARK